MPPPRLARSRRRSGRPLTIEPACFSMRGASMPRGSFSTHSPLRTLCRYRITTASGVFVPGPPVPPGSFCSMAPWCPYRWAPPTASGSSATRGTGSKRCGMGGASSSATSSRRSMATSSHGFWPRERGTRTFLSICGASSPSLLFPVPSFPVTARPRSMSRASLPSSLLSWKHLSPSFERRDRTANAISPELLPC